MVTKRTAAGREGFGELRSAQPWGGPLVEQAGVEGLGPVVRDVEILADAGETGGGPEGVPVSGFGSGAAEDLGVHETFHGEEGMAIDGLPVVGKTGATEG